MEEKEFDVSKLYLGCLGSARYLDDGNVEWQKREANPYFVYYKGPSNIFKEKSVGYDVSNNKAYYFFNEARNISDVLKSINEKYIIGQSFPLTTILGKEKSRISASELKRIVCNFNIADALQRDNNDEYLLCLKSVLDMPMNREDDIWYLVTKYIELLAKKNLQNMNKHFTK